MDDMMKWIWTWRIALLSILAVSACRPEKPKQEKLIQPEQQEVIRQIEKTYRK